ncbi:MotA/TolQ/ExbB proton channel family protein [Tropicibacter alexandrii]|uniref:MotA/TolQ/ExbB proton channel family protein n=1 Tax=Tropicibacter alexandrii TaxID=2267683 RepID=UPI0010089666|nr:MotA/TolQ/ExbB proton channel family protein [Tropicibacter alexandrii]
MLTQLTETLNTGGPALWVIAGLSVVTLALILWKLWRQAKSGFWRASRAEAALTDWQAGQPEAALARLTRGRSARARFLHAAMTARLTLPEDDAREEATRHARRLLAEARTGTRALDLIVTIAPLVGLLGTVLGMIEAFQALQETGNQADPAALAGGIWEALLTTAAGMGVAIPASVALSAFDSSVEKLSDDLNDLATRLFTAPLPQMQDAA